MKPAMLLVLVPMTMMQVRIMRVGMTHISVAMNMRMRFGHRPFMRMLMMCIMDVGVFMFQVAMPVFMLMPSLIPASGFEFVRTGSLNEGPSIPTSNRAIRKGGDILADAEIWDPATGLATPTASLVVPRTEHIATLLPDGRVLLVGSHTHGPDDQTPEVFQPIP